MIRSLFILLCTVIIFSVNAFANTGVVQFAPPNKKWIGVNDKDVAGITEQQFNKVLDDLSVIYTPIVKSKGGTLFFLRNWTDGTVNAYAARNGTNWIVAMFGGLARYNSMTADGFALVVCHELSHHLGGSPRSVNSWAANEGQSDYIGTMKCLREYFRNADSPLLINDIDADAVVKTSCGAVYQDVRDYVVCLRTAMAGKVLAGVLNELGQGPKPVSFSTPDTRIVIKTDNRHPDAQCRLDTYLAGALCNRDIFEEASDTDPVAGVCNTSQGDLVGTRPLCWYKP